MGPIPFRPNEIFLEMKRRLENLNALITGGNRGIGLAIAQRFAEEGANLFLWARNLASLEQAVTEVQKLGIKAIAHACDVSDQESVQKMVQHAIREFGRIDILVNNAGVHQASRFIDYSLEEFDQIMKVNLYGVFLVTKAVLPGMMERKKGKVINIISTAGKWGSKNQSAYNAPKHGVVGLTRCLGLEMAPFNINANAICPALVGTDTQASFLEQHSKILGITPEE
jgi:NAD(P)-dependent dehydrogenase (short-subunit alcohol dehydrogenase family)